MDCPALAMFRIRGREAESGMAAVLALRGQMVRERRVATASAAQQAVAAAQTGAQQAAMTRAVRGVLAAAITHPKRAARAAWGLLMALMLLTQEQAAAVAGRAGMAVQALTIGIKAVAVAVARQKREAQQATAAHRAAAADSAQITEAAGGRLSKSQSRRIRLTMTKFMSSMTSTRSARLRTTER